MDSNLAIVLSVLLRYMDSNLAIVLSVLLRYMDSNLAIVLSVLLCYMDSFCYKYFIKTNQQPIKDMLAYAQ
jgi:hypothetical protein